MKYMDLCYLLKRFDVKHVYYTQTMGINSYDRNHDFYHTIISKDSERVIERFKSAQMVE
ncbi:hypothetical protein LSTR_LSTR009797 [Laodelphax striatellus]|uniref:Uncharacterized protein n=1 Tax=Laodelphax striatellus TaxID=195883 RepID=A0A482XN07_LAOST|nr:hypothetical protein LSTR_LSTR009797 [Laodelphax striatellus]